MLTRNAIALPLSLACVTVTCAQAEEPFFKANFSSDAVGKPPATWILVRGTSGAALAVAEDQRPAPTTAPANDMP